MNDPGHSLGLAAARLRRIPAGMSLLLAAVEMAALYWLSSAEREIPGITGLLGDIVGNTMHLPAYGILGALLFHGFGGFADGEGSRDCRDLRDLRDVERGRAAAGGTSTAAAAAGGTEGARGAEGLAGGWRGILSVVAASAYGLSDEWHQSFVPGRSGNGLDLIVDVLAAALAVAAARRIARGRAMADVWTAGLLASALAAVTVAIAWGG